GLIDTLARHQISETLYRAIGEIYEEHPAINMKGMLESGITNEQDSDEESETYMEATEADVAEARDSDLLGVDDIFDDVCLIKSLHRIVKVQWLPLKAVDTPGKSVTKQLDTPAKPVTNAPQSVGPSTSTSSKSRSGTAPLTKSPSNAPGTKRARLPLQELSRYQQKKLREDKEHQTFHAALRGNKTSWLDPNVSAFMAFSMQNQLQRLQQPSFWETIAPTIVPAITPLLTALANQFLGDTPGPQSNAGQYSPYIHNSFCRQPAMHDYNEFHRQPSYRQPSYRQPSYRQPSYRQPRYGQPSYNDLPGQPSYNGFSFHCPYPSCVGTTSQFGSEAGASSQDFPTSRSADLQEDEFESDERATEQGNVNDCQDEASCKLEAPGSGASGSGKL
ncbi:hypothetical protein HDU78_011871, partial [Chytriomyces hyalinus]